MSADVRPIAESELPEWLRAQQTGFLNAVHPTAEDHAQVAGHLDCARTQGGFDADTGRCVATFRSFPQELTVPGGGSSRRAPSRA